MTDSIHIPSTCMSNLYFDSISFEDYDFVLILRIIRSCNTSKGELLQEPKCIGHPENRVPPILAHSFMSLKMI